MGRQGLKQSFGKTVLTVAVADLPKPLVCYACANRSLTSHHKPMMESSKYSQGDSPTTLEYQLSWLLAQVVFPAIAYWIHSAGMREAAPRMDAVRRTMGAVQVASVGKREETDDVVRTVRTLARGERGEPGARGSKIEGQGAGGGKGTGRDEATRQDASASDERTADGKGESCIA